MSSATHSSGVTSAATAANNKKADNLLHGVRLLALERGAMACECVAVDFTGRLKQGIVLGRALLGAYCCRRTGEQKQSGQPMK
eukprot:CAMPEP_0203933526 /NCGR_PEP_ID=MMETSP0359-20131031/71690_1 /ASSEMBLY_ACC=CAM_ASM_000338 /TAXON_ID=268821 /ORGANISM="Scrippsiella Hangoei, Strain SHTV-5" /LENGTH=82 /DNA_ID=CAMNT_0050863121 /DNA_START=21 /DNA_END=266 /DNA_ORIENTATION=-